MIFPHWNVVHRDTQNDRRIMTGTESPFSGRFDITIVGRRNRLWFISMCPGKASNGIGSVILFGSALISPNSVVHSGVHPMLSGLNLSFDPGPAIMHDSTFRMCCSAPGYTVSLHGDQKVWLYTRRLRICWDMGIQSMIVSPVIDGGEYFYRNYLATKGVCRISSWLSASEKGFTTISVNFLFLSGLKFAI